MPLYYCVRSHLHRAHILSATILKSERELFPFKFKLVERLYFCTRQDPFHVSLSLSLCEYIYRSAKKEGEMEWTRYEFSTLRGARDNNFVGEKVKRKGVESRDREFRSAPSLRHTFSLIDLRDQSTLAPLKEQQPGSDLARITERISAIYIKSKFCSKYTLIRSQLLITP